MSENDMMLIKKARHIMTDEGLIRALIRKAESDEARKKLEELADDAFRRHERIAFEHYD